ncbi:MAG: putative sulfate exporter family transporter [Gammaproteobacteria bacterium]|nr:putative sulfate exporter family transporter [Gammaproteobacteria bacterium]MDH5653167.1 putative sulfate exporter family transporter [Gammaproteobacteria bacterium]
MVYTKKTPWVLIIGIIMCVYAWLVQQQYLAGVIKYLETDKLAGEMVTMGYIFGVIGIVVGLWQQFMQPKEGHLDYYLSTIGGALLILLCVFAVKYGAEPVFKAWGAAAGKSIGWDFAKTLGINYILLGIIVGMIVVNVFKVPTWAENGVRLSRLGLKTGVILLGALYSAAELAEYSKWSIGLIFVFVLGSVGITLFMGRRRNIPTSMAGVLSAGLGVCGVSATVASAPVVNAKSSEIAYSIGTILLWGILMMFIFPPVGRALGMTYEQFGAWAGTGILNSAQVAAAALIYQPNGIETLKVAEIFNITRILVLPIIVLWLAVWYVEREQTAAKVNLLHVIVGKFPLFVLGFIVLFLLSTTGMFAPSHHAGGKFFAGEKAKLLKDEQIVVLQKAATDRPETKAALDNLIANKRVMSKEDDVLLRGMEKAKETPKEIKAVLKDAHKNAWKTSPRIGWFRDLIIWFFAFGLTGLGMQITVKAITQAGGQPLIIGTTVGTIKAVGALIAVLLLKDLINP